MLRTEIKAILDAYATPPRVVEQPPEVILLVGVNGTGKTTTSGKLARCACRDEYLLGEFGGL